jgi:K+-transporting ATPase ATPase B chain
MATVARARPLFDPPLVNAAIRDSFIKLAPWVQWRNPVMFVVLVGSVLITGLWLGQLSGAVTSEGRAGFVLAIALWLWATLLFANFAESLAEGAARRRPPPCDRASAM